MSKEYTPSGTEYAIPDDRSVPPEYIAEAPDIGTAAPEHRIPPQYGQSTEESTKKTEKTRTRSSHKRLLRKVVYGLSSAAMVVTLATSAIPEDYKPPVHNNEPVPPIIEDIPSTDTEDITDPVPPVTETAVELTEGFPAAEEVLKDYSDHDILGSLSVGSEDHLETVLLRKNVSFKSSGVSYDGSTNTLTIENYSDVFGLLYVFMEEDIPFTLEVKGENLLHQVTIGANDIIFKGNGTLNLGLMENGIYYSDVGELSLSAINDNALANIYFYDTIQFSGPEYQLGFSCPNSMYESLAQTVAQTLGLEVYNLGILGDSSNPTGITAFIEGHPSKVFDAINNMKNKQ